MGEGKAGVLLDVDGTLLDTNYLHAVAWWQAMRDAGIPGVTMTDTYQAIGIANDGLLQHVVPEATKRQARKAVKRHSKRYAKLSAEIVAFDRAAELIHRCAGSGLTVVLATSGHESDLDWMIPAVGVPTT